jgi:hypothetical protein
MGGVEVGSVTTLSFKSVVIPNTEAPPRIAYPGVWLAQLYQKDMPRGLRFDGDDRSRISPAQTCSWSPLPCHSKQAHIRSTSRVSTQSQSCAPPVVQPVCPMIERILAPPKPRCLFRLCRHHQHTWKFVKYCAGLTGHRDEYVNSCSGQPATVVRDLGSRGRRILVRMQCRVLRRSPPNYPRTFQ